MLELHQKDTELRRGSIPKEERNERVLRTDIVATLETTSDTTSITKDRLIC